MKVHILKYATIEKRKIVTEIEWRLYIYLPQPLYRKNLRGILKEF